MTSSVSNTSGFSFSRLWEVAKYYIPKVKIQFYIYLAVSLICSALCLIPGVEPVQMGIAMAVSALLPLLVYCGPLIFAKGSDTRIIDRLLPVSAAERLAFFYIYTLIVVPVIVLGPTWIANWLYLQIPAIQNESLVSLYEMKFHTFGMINVINIVGIAFTIMTCLLCVEYARHNRILWGIVSILITNMIIGIIGGILGGLAAFKQGLADGIEGKSEAEIESHVENLTSSVINDLNTANTPSIVALCVLCAGVIFVGWFTYRTIKRRNL